MGNLEFVISFDSPEHYNATYRYRGYDLTVFKDFNKTDKNLKWSGWYDPQNEKKLGDAKDYAVDFDETLNAIVAEIDKLLENKNQ